MSDNTGGERTGQSRAEISVAYERALRNENSDAWSKMERSEKIADLQAIENEYAAREGRVPAKVEAAALPTTTLGRYSPQKNLIQINQDSLDKANSAEHARRVETVLHEGTHSFQAQAANKTLKQNVNPQMTEEAEKAMKVPYVRPEQDRTAYRDHPTEVQARKETARKSSEVGRDKAAVLNHDKAHPQKINQILVNYDKSVLQNEASAEAANAGRNSAAVSGRASGKGAGQGAG